MDLHDRERCYAELVNLLRDFIETEKVLNPDTKLVDDLGLESIQIMQLVAEIEDVFDISISLTGLADVRTLSDLTDFVMRSGAMP